MLYSARMLLLAILSMLVLLGGIAARSLPRQAIVADADTIKSTLDDDYVYQVNDASALFNERGYLKSNSFITDGHDAISEFNGNLTYTKRIGYVPLTQDGFGCDLKLTYNGSVGHTIHTTLWHVGGVGKHNRFNMPEWILSVNDIAIQTFNFETDAIAFTDNGSDSVATEFSVTALIDGYHNCYKFVPNEGGEQPYGSVEFLTGDGGVRRFVSLESGSSTQFWVVLGEYRSFSKDDRAKGYMWESPFEDKVFFTLYEENGDEVEFEMYRPKWQNNFVPQMDPACSYIGTGNLIRQLLPTYFRSASGGSFSVFYQFAYNWGTFWEFSRQLFGRPVVTHAGEFNFDWHGVVESGYTNQLTIERDGLTTEIGIGDEYNWGRINFCYSDCDRALVRNITDWGGRTTQFDYSLYRRMGTKTTYYDRVNVDYRYHSGCDEEPEDTCLTRFVARRFSLLGLRLNQVTKPEGGSTYYSYYDDNNSRFPNPLPGVFDSMTVEYEAICPNTSDYFPCIRSSGFSALGRDPYFINMVVARTRVDIDDADTTLVSIDSLEYSWDDYAGDDYVTFRDRFHTQWRHMKPDCVSADCQMQVDLTYQYLPEPTPHTYYLTDRGWGVKLISKTKHGPLTKAGPSAAIADETVGSGTRTVGSSIDSTTYDPVTLLPVARTTTRDGVVATERYMYDWYGDPSEDTTCNLKSRSIINAIGDSTVTHYKSDYWTFPPPSASVYRGDIVDSVITYQGTDGAVLARTVLDHYGVGDSVGLPGQLSAKTEYLVSNGSLVDSISERYEYVNRNIYFYLEGCLRKSTNPLGDSTIFSYRSEPVLVHRLNDSGTVETAVQYFSGARDDWFKREAFESDRMYDWDTILSVDTSMVADTVAVRSQGDEVLTLTKSDTLDESTLVHFELRLREYICSLPWWEGYAEIQKNGVLYARLDCDSGSSPNSGSFPADSGDVITAKIHAGVAKSGLLMPDKDLPHNGLQAAFWYSPEMVIDTVGIRRSDAQVFYRQLEWDKSPKYLSDGNGYLTELEYDDLRRVSRIKLPYGFTTMVQIDTTITEHSTSTYPTLNGHMEERTSIASKSTSTLTNCTADTLWVLDSIYCWGDPDPPGKLPLDDIGCAQIRELPLFQFSDAFSDKSDKALIAVDSAFLNVYCTTTDGQPGQLWLATGNAVLPGCNSGVTISNPEFKSVTLTVGWNRISVSGASVTKPLIFAPSSTPVKSSLTLQKIGLISGNHPNPDLRPKLDVYYRRTSISTIDSSFSIALSYDDDPNDGDAVSVTTTVKVGPDLPLRQSEAIFDPFGRVHRVKSYGETGHYSTYTYYDFRDRVDSTIDRLGFRTSWQTYDYLDRSTKLTHVDSTRIETQFSHANAVNFGLDTLFQLRDSQLYVVRSRDENGHYVWTYSDVLGRKRLEQSLSSSGELRTYFDYDEYGNLVTVIKPEGDSVNYRYNSLGWLKKEWSADRDTIFYEHDKLGRVVAMRDGNTAALDNLDTLYWRYTDYDAVSRVVSSGLMAISGNDTTRSVLSQNFYDQENSSLSQGRLSVNYSHDYSYGEKWDYDPRGRVDRRANYFNANLIQEPGDTTAYPDSTLSGDSLIVAYTYNWTDQVTSVTYPDGMVVTYEYDRLGRLKSVGDTLNPTKYARLTYTPRDELDSLILQDTLQIVNHTYAPRGWLLSINEGVIGSLAPLDLFAESLYYDDPNHFVPAQYNGNISTQRCFGPGLAQTGLPLSYTYDEADRLTGVLYQETNPLEWFVYDRNGNFDTTWRVNRDTVVYAYESGTNRVQALSGGLTTQYTYDANGNMISDATKGTSLHFDPYNQLDSVAVPGYGPSCLRFAYNSSGERVSKTYVYWRREVCGGGIYKVLESTGTSGVSGPEPPPDTLASMCWKQKTASTYYVYGNGQVLAEYANPAVAGSPKAKYIYAGDRRIAMIDQSGNLFFYLNDHLGSARVVMNAQTGRSADYHWYSAYGAPLHEQTSTNQAYKYTGKPFDDEGGFDLYYYGARYYDPDRGFISVDPLDSEYPGWGPYVYTLDNPIKFIDPDGRFPWVVAALAAYIILSTPDEAQAPTSEGDHVEATFGEKTLQWAGAILGAYGLIRVGNWLKGGTSAAEKTGASKAADAGSSQGASTADGVAPGKRFTQAQKRDILRANQEKNNGVLRSDQSGERLVRASKHQKGVTPPANEAQVDHIVPRSKGGPNTIDNAQVLSRLENLKKGDKLLDFEK